LGVRQEYSTTLYLRQVWRDARLSFAGLDEQHAARRSAVTTVLTTLWKTVRSGRAARSAQRDAAPPPVRPDVDAGRVHSQPQERPVSHRHREASGDPVRRGRVVRSSHSAAPPRTRGSFFHTITVPNRLIRLSPDGTILYSQRLTLTLSCDMILNKYPMDNQTCKIELGSCESTAVYTVVHRIRHGTRRTPVA